PLGILAAVLSLVIFGWGLSPTAGRVRSGPGGQGLLVLTLEGGLFWIIGVMVFRGGMGGPAAFPLLFQCVGCSTPFSPASLLPLYSLPSPALFAAYGLGSYLHAPSLVHVALALGWPHREERWRSPVLGWYVLYGVLFLIAMAGLLSGQEPLFRLVDEILRAQLLDFLAFVVSVIALLWARRGVPASGSHRRSLDLAAGGILLGLGAGWLAALLPVLKEPLLPGIPLASLLLLALPIGLAAAVLRNRLFDDRRLIREVHDLQVRLLLEQNLTAASSDLLRHLCDTF